MEHFDVTQAPLKGVHLVEANAGTGKTFNISSLVVRLIAEGALDLKNLHFQILVVVVIKHQLKLLDIK